MGHTLIRFRTHSMKRSPTAIAMISKIGFSSSSDLTKAHLISPKAAAAIVKYALKVSLRLRRRGCVSLRSSSTWSIAGVTTISAETSATFSEVWLAIIAVEGITITTTEECRDGI